MSPRELARSIAGGRIVAGAALLLVPRLATRGWLGEETSRRAGTQVIARAMGVRDIVLGAMALHTLDRPEVAVRWQRTLAGVDAVDLLATLAARRELPRTGVALVVAIASSGVAGQLWAAHGLAESDEVKRVV